MPCRRLRKRLWLGPALSVMAAPVVLLASLTAAAQDDGGEIPAEFRARMDGEKAARRACKIEICKAFAERQTSGTISCDVTKTWLRREIVGRIVGGDYVWPYGHMQCTLALNLDKAEIAKARTTGTASVGFPAHELVCNVSDQDPAKGQAFSVKASVTPRASFEGGEAKSVELEPVKTEGSQLASAAVGALMAADQLTGMVSGAAAAEINAFLYSKCAADGVEVKKPS